LSQSWEIGSFVIKGNREEIPSDCPKEYKELIEKCWAHNLHERPSFDEIVAKLEQIFQTIPNLDKRDSTLNP
jgi:thiamine kinase-like enzyme